MKIIELLGSNEFKNKKVLKKLISYYLNLSGEDIIKKYDLEISDNLLNKIKQSYIDFEKNKKPLEYILGYVEFFGNKFFVDSRVLIPRPETEYMILAVEEYGKSLNKGKNIHIVDVGTGCGVLGISSFLNLKDYLNINKLILTDISKDALQVAKINIDKLIDTADLEKVQFIKSDLISEIDKSIFDIKTILVANLPYIPDKLFEENVEENVKKWEPSIAFLGGEDGLDLYRKMINQFLEKNINLKNIVMFLEMMDYQVDILSKEFDFLIFEKIKTFHFNIKIVKCYLK